MPEDIRNSTVIPAEEQEIKLESSYEITILRREF
jgi:hypothetical protein